MKKNLAVIGAGGHGKVIADLASRLRRYDTIIFLDDNEKLKHVSGYDVVGKTDTAMHYAKEYEFVIAIGNPSTRERLHSFLAENGAEFATLIHPFSYVSASAQIGAGAVIMAGAVVQPDTKIGCGVIVNTSASVDHECIIGDFSHIAVGAHVAGEVTIGSKCWIGAGATVSNNVCIKNDITIGAGAVVIKNIDEPGIYVGVPAHIL